MGAPSCANSLPKKTSPSPVAPVELGRAAAGEEGLVPQEGRQRVAEAQAPASVTPVGRRGVTRRMWGKMWGLMWGDRNLEIYKKWRMKFDELMNEI